MTADNLDPSLQYDDHGRLRHLLTLREMPREVIESILDSAQRIADSGAPRDARRHILANLFLEPSTRTRCSFEIAAGNLGWQVVNVDNSTSSVTKGESLADTLKTLAAMGARAFAIRNTDSAALWAAAAAAPEGVSVINAGGGSEDHPTQGLLDALTIRQCKGRLEGLRVAICGDLHHSRVANSDIHAFTALGIDGIRLVGPPALLPDPVPAGCETVTELDAGIRDADVIIMLRIQRERMGEADVPDAAQYHREWGLTAERLRAAHPECLVMHPGPANPGVEITQELLDAPQSAVRRQVANGVHVRMHLLHRLIGNPDSST